MNDIIIEQAREHWSLGNANITLVAARENHVYCVEQGHLKTALRVHRPGYRNIAEIISELQWMEMLALNGICVPSPVRASDNSLFLTSTSTVVSLLNWVDGTPLSQFEAHSNLYYELGRLLAQMQALAHTWEQPEGFVRPCWNLVGENPTWGRFWENPKLTASQVKRLLYFRDYARERLHSEQGYSRGLIHADLVPDNVLYDGQSLQLIDFDDGGVGYHLFDLATITHRSRRQGDGHEYASATLEGYGSIVTVQLEDIAFFEALRACTYVGWNISRLNETGAASRNRRFISEADAAIEAFI